MSELKSRAHSYGQNCHHFVWGPKYRIPMLKPTDIRKVCAGILRLVAIQNGCRIHEMRILKDHIHMFVEIPPTLSVSRAFQLFKGISSRTLRRNFPWLRKFKSLWTKGKFYRSVGNVTTDVVEHYIRKSQGSWEYFDRKRTWSYPEQTRLVSY